MKTTECLLFVLPVMVFGLPGPPVAGFPAFPGRILFWRAIHERLPAQSSRETVHLLQNTSSCRCAGGESGSGSGKLFAIYPILGNLIDTFFRISSNVVNLFLEVN